MKSPRLLIFDVDGTLVDSQAQIVGAMDAAFALLGRPPPPRNAVLGIVGLSLPVAMARLCPDHPADVAPLVEAYKAAFAAFRHRGDGAALAPLYPGARDALDRLSADPWTLLGVATGKSRRGLSYLLDLHGLLPYFQTTQVADDHPSKPDPAMVLACLRDAGVDAARAVMIGDTTYDMEMAAAARVPAIGVSWGYHEASDLRAAGATAVIDDFAALPDAIERLGPTP